MKKLLCFTVFFGLFIGNPLILQGQGTKRVNEQCSGDAECGKGYYCVEVEVKGTKKKVCSKCDRSTLNNYKREIDDACKGVGQGWTPGSSSDYKEATARDGRVEQDVFDVMIEKAEECIRAREEREDKCFEGGDQPHKDEINSINESIKRIISHRETFFRQGRLIYCSKDDYEDALDNYESKCQVRNTNFFSQIELAVGVMASDYRGNKKIDCSKLEEYIKQCKECYETAKDLLEDCFDGNESYFPKDFKEKLEKAKSLYEKSDKLSDDIKSKKLCK